MRMNYVPQHSWDHADSEYVSYVGADHKVTEFIGNKQTYRHWILHISRDYILKLLFYN